MAYRGILLEVEGRYFTMQKGYELTEENDLNKKYPFQVIDGGKGPRTATGGGPTIHNWLKDLDIGTMFLVKDKRKFDFILPKFQVSDFYSEKAAAQLYYGPGLKEKLEVDTMNFSICFALVTILDPEVEAIDE